MTVGCPCRCIPFFSFFCWYFLCSFRLIGLAFGSLLCARQSHGIFVYTSWYRFGSMHNRLKIRFYFFYFPQTYACKSSQSDSFYKRFSIYALLVSLSISVAVFVRNNSAFISVAIRIVFFRWLHFRSNVLCRCFVSGCYSVVSGLTYFRLFLSI